jgi:hypothetical protein
VRPMKILMGSARYQEAFCRVGETWEVSTEVQNTLEEFTCAMYGDRREKNVNEVRYKKLH